MSITIEKAKQASERFLLVRLNPARYILPSSIGSGKYEITMPFLINKIERNGVALTNVTAIPTNDDEWYQDETTLTVTVKLASAPNDSNNILISYYYLFYTGTKFRSWHEDPEDINTDLRDWNPRISTYPSILKSFDNITDGVFTLSSSTLDIINTDYEFQNYLTDEDSFYNKECLVWLCITDESNIQRIFTGTVASININKNFLSISIVDGFKNLSNIALMGDSPNEAYFLRQADSFPNVYPNDDNKPCIFFCGKISRHKTEALPLPIAGMPYPYEIREANPAVCTNYTPDVSVSVNRVWGLCRSFTGGLSINPGTMTGFTNLTGQYWAINSPSITNMNIGDTYGFNAGADYGLIVHVGSFNYGGNPYNLVIRTAGTVAGGSGLSVSSISIVIERAGIFYFPLLFRDYSESSTGLTSGNNYRFITFINNFEANIGLPSALDPQTDNVLFRVTGLGDILHGDFIENIMDRVGLNTNAASFTQANTELDVNVAFQIPYFDEYDYDIYLKYVGDILKSTLGYLKLNNDNEVEYHLLDLPSSIITRNDHNIIQDSASINIEYQDIATEIIAYNPHASSKQQIEATPSPSITERNNKAYRLHGVYNIDRFRHVLESINDRISTISNYKAQRKATYSFETSTDDIDTELGSDLQLENDIVLGTNKTQDIKVISIEKSPKSTRIQASDLKGL